MRGLIIILARLATFCSARKQQYLYCLGCFLAQFLKVLLCVVRKYYSIHFSLH